MCFVRLFLLRFWCFGSWRLKIWWGKWSKNRLCPAIIPLLLICLKIDILWRTKCLSTFQNMEQWDRYNLFMIMAPFCWKSNIFSNWLSSSVNSESKQRNSCFMIKLRTITWKLSRFINQKQKEIKIQTNHLLTRLKLSFTSKILKLQNEFMAYINTEWTTWVYSSKRWCQKYRNAMSNLWVFYGRTSIWKTTVNHFEVGYLVWWWRLCCC